jgi:hypothetical protein
LRPCPPTTMTHPATAAHAKCALASCIGGRCSQCSPSPTANASHDDNN